MSGWTTKTTPGIDMSDLAEEWAVMPPSARRHAMRARLLGTDRTLFARIAKWLGIAAPHTPPLTRRVAARATVLAGLSARAYLEIHRDEIKDSEKCRDEPLPWLKGVGIAGELEPQERSFVKRRFGRADQTSLSINSWRAEGLGVLAWAMNRFRVPAYDEIVDTIEAQDSVGFGSPFEVAKEFLNSCTLRPASEIELFATHATLVTWRLRQFRLTPGPWDFDAYLRRHASFRDTWLEGLRFIDGDLAIGDQSIVNAPADKVEACERIALERQIAVYWLQGDNPVYSKVDPSTLLSAC